MLKRSKRERRRQLAVALKYHDNRDRAPRVIAKGKGLIAEKAIGENGFGYDPIFYYPPFEKTFAQLSQEQKNRISHRGKALMEVRDELEKVIVWIKNHADGCPH